MSSSEGGEEKTAYGTFQGGSYPPPHPQPPIGYPQPIPPPGLTSQYTHGYQAVPVQGHGGNFKEDEIERLNDFIGKLQIIHTDDEEG